jgi:secreted trypsin-like serine protease
MQEGTPATDAVPLVGQLRMADGKVSCTVYWLADRWLATAKHCVLAEKELNVRYGDTVIDGNTPKYQVLTAYCAENADFALLKVKGSAPEGTPKLHLGTAPAIGSHALAVGWGRTVTDWAVREEIHVKELEVRKDSTCADDASKLCAGAVSGGPCPGDSGGPLLFPEAGENRSAVGSLIRGECEIKDEGAIESQRSSAYVRNDAIAGWAAKVMKEDAAPCWSWAK